MKRDFGQAFAPADARPDMSDQIATMISVATTSSGNAGVDPSGRWWLAVNSIHPDPDQPRGKVPTPEELQERADSLRGVGNDGPYARGQLQPVVVRPDPRQGGDGENPREWILVVGERRWLAAVKGGLEYLWAAQAPDAASADDVAILKAQLTENEQREDLSDIDIALAAERLAQRGCSVAEINALLRYGNRRTLEQKRKVARELHPDVRQMIRQGVLPGTHGRVLIRASKADQPLYASFAVDHKLSTRDLKVLLSFPDEGAASVTSLTARYAALMDERRQMRDLQQAGAPVVISTNNGGTLPRIVPSALVSVQALKRSDLTPDDLYRALLSDIERLRPFCTASVAGGEASEREISDRD